MRLIHKEVIMPPGIEIGPITIRFYGIILMISALAGAFLVSIEVKRRKFNTELVWDALIWLIIGGVIGGRLWHIFTPSPSLVAQGITTKYYLTHPLAAISTWNGGLGIPGTVIGGAVMLYFFCRKRKLSFPTWVDMAVPGLALGQAIGRWANYINQELYGAPTSLPWAITIDPHFRLQEFMHQATYHPLFLYESLWNLGNMFLLLWLARKHSRRLIPGDLLLIYMITYPFARFMLEFIRLDSAMIGGVNANQTFMAIVAIFALAVLIYRHSKKKSEKITEDQPEKL